MGEHTVDTLAGILVRAMGGKAPHDGTPHIVISWRKTRRRPLAGGERPERARPPALFLAAATLSTAKIHYDNQTPALRIFNVGGFLSARATSGRADLEVGSGLHEAVL